MVTRTTRSTSDSDRPAAPTGASRKAPRAAKSVAKARTPAKAAARSTTRALATAAPSRDAPSWNETLSDGTRVIIRPIRREDAALERAFIRRLSPESRRLRFLGQIGDPSDALVRSLTDIDYRRDVAFVALVHRDGEKREIGVARYSTGAGGNACECAVTVADEWRNRGLGVALMRHLIDVARERGIRSMFSIDEADNGAMRELARFLGFTRRRNPDDATQVVHTLALR
jgi:GNAT superfamily N-acetyltransferase